MYPFTPELRIQLGERLDAFDRRSNTPTDLRHAAVAVTVVSDEQGWACFLLTARAAGLRAHASQWALPGGRLDDGEDAEEAARRELEEEVNVAVGPEAVLALLDDYPTRSGYLITPVVIWGGSAGKLAANPVEVSAVHRVRLAELDAPGSPRLVQIPESNAPVIQMLVGKEWVHAPTAAVLYQFREVALHGREARVAHYEQPVWAWR